jgi:hypothetical protein
MSYPFAGDGFARELTQRIWQHSHFAVSKAKPAAFDQKKQRRIAAVDLQRRCSPETLTSNGAKVRGTRL